MKLLFLLMLGVTVIAAVALVQSGVRFSPNAYSQRGVGVTLPKACSNDSDCQMTKRLCPRNTKCIPFMDNNFSFSCKSGKCVIVQK